MAHLFTGPPTLIVLIKWHIFLLAHLLWRPTSLVSPPANSTKRLKWNFWKLMRLFPPKVHPVKSLISFQIFHLIKLATEFYSQPSYLQCERSSLENCGPIASKILWLILLSKIWFFLNLVKHTFKNSKLVLICSLAWVVVKFWTILQFFTK